MRINNITAISGIAPFTGYCHDFIKKSCDSGKEPEELKEKRINLILEEERKKVQPIYNSKGKLIEYDKYGRHLSITV